MNKALYLIVILLSCNYVYSMEESLGARDSMEGKNFQFFTSGDLSDSIIKTNINDNDNPVQHFFDCIEKPYQEYKKIIQEIVPQLGYVQNQMHNPLIRAVQALDKEFIIFLLNQKANPLFRGTDCINAFDALNIESKEDFSQISYKMATVSEVMLLLKQHIKPGEVYTHFPAKSINPFYKEKINIQEWLEHSIDK